MSNDSSRPEWTSKRLAEWKAAALADGWQEKPGGPWGHQQQPIQCDEQFGGYKQTGKRNDGDNSSALYKQDMVVILVNRELKQRGETVTDRGASGWFDHGGSGWAFVPGEYDAAAIERLRGTCPRCMAVGPRGRLVRGGFAAVVCPGCAAKMPQSA